MGEPAGPKETASAQARSSMMGGGVFDEDAADRADADRDDPTADDPDTDNPAAEDPDTAGEHESVMVATEDPLDEPPESDA